MSKEIIEKMKENDKLFKEKMNTLNEKKIKVIKPNSKSQERERHTHSHARTNTHTNSHKNQKLAIKKGSRFNFVKDKFFSNKVCKISEGDQLIFYSEYMNLNDKISLYEMDNNISFNFFSKKINNYSDEEQDIYFISKIRELQKDIKYKTDLIIDLQNKLKQKDDDFIKVTKNEIDDLKNQVKKVSKEKEEKMREIQRLETENYNQKQIIDHWESQSETIKSKNEAKKDEIENLNTVIDKLKIEDDDNKDKIKRLEILNKNTLKDYDTLKLDFNKLKNEKKDLEKMIEDQKLEMENYRKHIDTLRKVIVEDTEGSKLNKKIDENNKIISKNKNMLDTKRKKLTKKLSHKKINTKTNKTTPKKNDSSNKTFNSENKKLEPKKEDNLNKTFTKENNTIETSTNDNLNKSFRNDSKKVKFKEEDEKDFDRDNEVTTYYQSSRKELNRNNSDLSDRVKKVILPFNQSLQNIDLNSLNFNPNKRERDNKSVTLRKRINRNIIRDDDEDEENRDKFYKTYSNFNEIRNMRNMSNTLREENDYEYFPSQRYLLERNDELNNLEVELDLLLKEKNNLDNEIMKLPEHPRTLKDIKLKNSIRLFTDVIRNNKQIELRQEEVVVGDIITLSAGSVVPADLYLFDSKDLFINQSSFTGESDAVEKSHNIRNNTNDVIEMSNICLMGCTVISGQGKGIVIKKGLDTYIGKMNTKKEVVKEETSFDQGMNHITGDRKSVV